jgi:hypothetical protein
MPWCPSRALLGFFLAIVAGADLSFAQTFSKNDCLEITRVDRWDFLYIRARPDHTSKAVGAIAVTSSNPLVITGACTPQTSNTKRLWCPVVYYATRETPIRGWVKMYFTRKIECPPSAAYYQTG